MWFISKIAHENTEKSPSAREKAIQCVFFTASSRPQSYQKCRRRVQSELAFRWLDEGFQGAHDEIDGKTHSPLS